MCPNAIYLYPGQTTLSHVKSVPEVDVVLLSKAFGLGQAFFGPFEKNQGRESSRLEKITQHSRFRKYLEK